MKHPRLPILARLLCAALGHQVDSVEERGGVYWFRCARCGDEWGRMAESRKIKGTR